jgi:hypothetical protein
MDVTAQPIELGHDDRRTLVIGILDAPGGLEGCPQLRPASSITLAALDLDKAGDDVEALGLAEAADRLALRLQAEPRPALLLGADPDVLDAVLDFSAPKGSK